MKKLSDYKEILKSKGLNESQVNDIIVTVANLARDVMPYKMVELPKEDLENLKI